MKILKRSLILIKGVFTLMVLNKQYMKPCLNGLSKEWKEV